jgi:SAM-dependent methyltransferase
MKWAESYWHGVPIMRRRIEHVAKRTRPGRVLDLGCNDGQLSQCIFEQGNREVVGVDIVPDNIQKSQAAYPDVTFLLTDGRTLPFPDDHFDTVVLAEVLEHLGKDQGHVLAEAQRVSKGHLIWTLPVGPYWLGEPTHQWELTGVAIRHHTEDGVDDCVETELSKHIVVVEWDRKRQLTA